MEFRDLKAQYQSLKSEIDKEIFQVISETDFIHGKKVFELEDLLADYVGVKHCVTCGNGTDALTMALKYWNIGRGDAVFVPDFTFFASGEVVSSEGATPVFVDICQDTCNISAINLENAIIRVMREGKLIPRVIIAVDLFGLPADYRALREIALRYDLVILEDAAQGFGGSINEKKACSFGDISTTSFFPAKPLGCYGDGGAMFTDSDQAANFFRSIRVHGKGKNKYDNIRIGMNSRLDTLQAAILISKFRAFKDHELDAVNKTAAAYTKALKAFVKTPETPEGYYSSWAQYCIQLPGRKEREGLKEYLKGLGIPTMIYYPTPMRKQKAFQTNECKTTECKNPITDQLCESAMQLPIYPYMEKDDIHFVANAIREYFVK